MIGVGYGPVHTLVSLILLLVLVRLVVFPAFNTEDINPACFAINSIPETPGKLRLFRLANNTILLLVHSFSWLFYLFL